MTDQLLAVENVRLTSELRRTRIELAKALVAISELEEMAIKESPEGLLSFPIWSRIQKLWKDLNERI